jgi:hypothetical protein
MGGFCQFKAKKGGKDSIFGVLSEYRQNRVKDRVKRA